MHSSLASPTGHWNNPQKSLDMAYWKYSGSYFRAFVVLVDVVVEKILQKYQSYDLYSFVSSCGLFPKIGLPPNHPF